MDSIEYIELIERKKEVQELLLNFIDSIDDDKVEILKLSEIIENNKIELKEFLYLITNISENHHRYPSLFPKIEQILLIFKESIKQNFSNYEIFQIFKNNKKILLFLIKEKLFEIDPKICNILISYQYKNNKYLHYFFPEIKPFIDSKLVSQIEKEIHEFIQNGFEVFENNRKIGENDLYVCNLIRNDLVEDFIAYTTKSCMNLSSNINRKSIFETNSFLMERTPTLTEYATYFGSIQIFKYLAINNVQLKPSLWEYAVYSNNAEIIHLLEEHKVKCNDYCMCFNDSIKCHHNNIATYIKENYINYYINTNNGIMYYNYTFFPKYENICSFFASSCKYNHQTFVEVFLYSTEIIININNNKILFFVFF